MNARYARMAVALLLAALLAACETSAPTPSAAGGSSAVPAASAPSAETSASASATPSTETLVSPSAAASSSASAAPSDAASSAASVAPNTQASSAASAEVSSVGAASPAASAQTSAETSQVASVDLVAAADYCAAQGGTVVLRYPLLGANAAPARQLRLDGSVQFCQFERSFDESPDGFRSRISISLATLYAEQPTLATVAYLNGPEPQQRPTPSASPGSFYCSQLGGTDVWGGQGSAAGGTWRTDDPAVVQSAFGPDVDACVFPDGSIIDSFGLFYRNANGTVRGTDLAEVIRYRPDGLPPIFPGGRSTADLPDAAATPPAFASPAASTPASVAASAAPAESPAAFDQPAAEAFCEQQGGRVVLRRAVWGTNEPEARQIQLSGSQPFCNFERAQPDNPGSDFRSQISVALATLYSEEPTLAMLAYLAPRPLPKIPAGVNPASVYCSWLGGTSLFGGANSASGGGWVKLDDTSSAFDELSMCVFPDLSSIDDWGLTYNAGGAIRGVDLATVARYQPAEAPIVFPEGRLRSATDQASPPALGAAQSNTVAIDETSNGSAITLDAGQELVVALTANPTTGFAWEVDRVDQAVLAQAGAAEFVPLSSSPGLAGAPSTETLRFRAVGAGETTLSLAYRRPFDPPASPAPENSFTIQVTVR